MEHIAIIPARSGSKEIKDKNIKLLAGKPLLQYTIEAAMNSNVFDCIHVSTDNEEYAEIAQTYGIDIPFLRCLELSTDTADSWSVVRFVLEQYKKLGKKFEMVTLLQPTSPLRNANDIQGAYHLFCKKNAKAIISVCKETSSALLANTIDETLSLDGFIDLQEIGRRQDMPIYYRINGAIYMLKSCVLDKLSDLYGKESYAYIMPEDRSIDIDNALDFKIAEIILEEYKRKGY